MTNRVDRIVILISVFLLGILFYVIGYREVKDFSGMTFTGVSARDLYFEFPTPTPTPQPEERNPNPWASYYCKYFKPYCLGEVTTTCVEMKLTSLGKYYITAYCPSECGYNGHNYPVGWRTASGTICHRASNYNRISEPTTCAISRSVHSFNELFYIKEFDRVFISEDTGSGVQGKHLDLFYEEFSDVQSFPTGYYEVFNVEFIEYTVRLSEYDVRKMCNKFVP